MADLSGQTIASSYEQLLSLPDGGGNANTLVAVTDGDAGTTFGIKLATNKVEIIPGSNDTNAFEVSQADGTAVLTVDSTNARVGIGGAPAWNLQVGDQTTIFGANLGSDGVLIAPNANNTRLIIEGQVDASIILVDDGAADNDEAMMIQTVDGTTKFRSIAEDTAAVKDNILSLDHGTGNVGIGTASPGRDFVISNGGAGGMEFGAGDTSSLISLFNRSNSAYTEFDIEAKEIHFFAGASPAEKMRLDSSGNLGIGVTPEKALHVHNDDPVIRISDANSSSLATATPHIEFYDRADTNQLGLIGYLSTGDGILTINNKNNASMDFKTNNTTALTIDNAQSATFSGQTLKVNNDTEANIIARRGSRESTFSQNSSGGVFTLLDSSGNTGLQISSYGNSFFSGGKVGIGCSDQEATLQVNTSVTDATISAIDVGIGLEFNGADGGHVGMAVIDATSGRGMNRGFIGFRGSSASGSGNSNIVFATSTGSGVAPVEIMRINTAGTVLMGTGATITDGGRLQVNGGNAGGGYVATFDHSADADDANGIQIRAGNSSNSGTTRFVNFQESDGGAVGGVRTDSGNVQLYNTSDKRLKKNIRPSEWNGLDIINKSKLYDFEWIKSGETFKGGWLAQDMLDVWEDVVVKPDKTDEHYHIATSYFVPMLVKAVQELSEKVTELENKLGE